HRRLHCKGGKVITWNDIRDTIDQHAATYASNRDLCRALGIDDQDLENSELQQNPLAGPLMTGVCVGLSLGKDLYRENQDHAPIESHDEFLASLPEAQDETEDEREARLDSEALESNDRAAHG